MFAKSLAPAVNSEHTQNRHERTVDINTPASCRESLQKVKLF